MGAGRKTPPGRGGQRKTEMKQKEVDYYGCHPETMSARELADVEDAERAQDRFLARLEEYDDESDAEPTVQASSMEDALELASEDEVD